MLKNWYKLILKNCAVWNEKDFNNTIFVNTFLYSGTGTQQNVYSTEFVL